MRATKPSGTCSPGYMAFSITPRTDPSLQNAATNGRWPWHQLWCYRRISLEVEMTDVLIRDVPDDVIAALDAHAGRLGLSRSEYVRRRLAQDAATSGSPVSVQDLARFADLFGDLADPDVMSQAWQ
jgi:Ribbon-helix-helix protein, copG family